MTTICQVNRPTWREKANNLIRKKWRDFGAKIGVRDMSSEATLMPCSLSKSPRNNDVPCFMFNFYAKYAICKRKCDSKFNLKSPSQTRSKTSYSLEKASIGLLTENCTIKQVLKLVVSRLGFSSYAHLHKSLQHWFLFLATLSVEDWSDELGRLTDVPLLRCKLVLFLLWFTWKIGWFLDSVCWERNLTHCSVPKP